MRKALFIIAFWACLLSGGTRDALPFRAGSVFGDSTKYDLSSCVNTFDSLRTEKTAAGWQYWFVDKNFIDGRTIKLSEVGPRSASHLPHRHSEDEFFFILEGEAELYLNGETRIVRPFTSFYCPSQSLHGIRNVGDSQLKYLVIKKYEK